MPSLNLGEGEGFVRMIISRKWLYKTGSCQQAIDLAYEVFGNEDIDVYELCRRMLIELPDNDKNEWFMLLYRGLLGEMEADRAIELSREILDRFKYILPEKYHEVFDSDSNIEKIARTFLREARDRYSSMGDLQSDEAYREYAVLCYLEAVANFGKSINMYSRGSNRDKFLSKVPFYLVRAYKNFHRDCTFDDALYSVWIPHMESVGKD